MSATSLSALASLAGIVMFSSLSLSAEIESAAPGALTPPLDD